MRKPGVKKNKKAKKDSLPKKLGRPTKYDEENFPRMAYTACAKMGAKIEDIAELFQVNRDTVYNWMETKPIFFDAIKYGRDLWDSNEAEVAMQKIVTGYDYDEVTVTEGASGTTTTTTTKHIPPNIKAIMFWLQNRHGSRWKNVSRIEQTIKTDGEMRHIYSGEAEMKIELKNLDKKELENFRDLISRATPDGAVTES